MNLDTNVILKLLVAVGSVLIGLAAFAIKSPKYYIEIVGPRLGKICNLISILCFGMMVMGYYAQRSFSPLVDAAKSAQADDVKNMMLLIPVIGVTISLLLFLFQLYLYGIASDATKLSEPVETKE